MNFQLWLGTLKVQGSVPLFRGDQFAFAASHMPDTLERTLHFCFYLPRLYTFSSAAYFPLTNTYLYLAIPLSISRTAGFASFSGSSWMKGWILFFVATQASEQYQQETNG
jgi:hypothetical protein